MKRRYSEVKRHDNTLSSSSVSDVFEEKDLEEKAPEESSESILETVLDEHSQVDYEAELAREKEKSIKLKMRNQFNTGSSYISPMKPIGVGIHLEDIEEYDTDLDLESSEDKSIEWTTSGSASRSGSASDIVNSMVSSPKIQGNIVYKGAAIFIQ